VTLPCHAGSTQNCLCRLTGQITQKISLADCSWMVCELWTIVNLPLLSADHFHLHALSVIIFCYFKAIRCCIKFLEAHCPHVSVLMLIALHTNHYFKNLCNAVKNKAEWQLTKAWTKTSFREGTWKVVPWHKAPCCNLCVTAMLSAFEFEGKSDGFQHNSGQKNKVAKNGQTTYFAMGFTCKTLLITDWQWLIICQSDKREYQKIQHGNLTVNV